MIEGELYFSVEPIHWAFPSGDEEHDDTGFSSYNQRFRSHEGVGFLVVYPEIDADGFLSLHFISEAAASKLQLKSGSVSCEDNCSHPLFDLSGDELADLISSTPREQLFDLHYGRFQSWNADPKFVIEAPTPD